SRLVREMVKRGMNGEIGTDSELTQAHRRWAGRCTAFWRVGRYENRMSANTSHSSSSTLHRREERKCSRTSRAQELVDSEMPPKPWFFQCGPQLCQFSLRDPISSTRLQIRSAAGTARS